MIARSDVKRRMQSMSQQPTSRQPTSQRPGAQEVDAVIVGAGFAGLYQLFLLRELGLSIRVFEAGDGVGGTWYWNRYPGARCDVQSLDYSYSFSEELQQEWEWSEKYATQPEILRYADHVADRFGLREHITFGTRVTSVRFDEAARVWTVRTSPRPAGPDRPGDGGETVTARFVIMATGCLSNAKGPEVPGIDDFQGPTYHTGHWPHEGVDFTGRRVAVIGTGSSGIQAIPLIAEQAAELAVFQRTANFSIPARNRPLDADEVRDIKSRYAEYRAEMRMTQAGFSGTPPTRSALEVSVAERQAAFEDGWRTGGLGGISRAFTDTGTSEVANEFVAEFIRTKIRTIVDDPETAEALSPRSHPYGTKRPCLDTGYYATFNQPHVTLVDLREEPIKEITERGIRTAARHHELDAIVFATGFDALTGSLTAIDIRGKGGRALTEKWAAGPRSYLGLVSAGFPNLFTVAGPLSPSVLSNMMVSIEQHVEWITDCIAHLRANGIAEIDATVEAEDGWVAHVAEAAAQTLFPKAASWYMGANVPGKPRVFMPYVGGVGVYRETCAEVAADGYRGFTLSR
jgi:cyclohexanone monooxygenase